MNKRVEQSEEFHRGRRSVEWRQVVTWVLLTIVGILTYQAKQALQDIRSNTAAISTAKTDVAVLGEANRNLAIRVDNLQTEVREGFAGTNARIAGAVEQLNAIYKRQAIFAADDQDVRPKPSARSSRGSP